jgi:anhydro-N-acetylmuramic acid kinase
MRELLEYIAKPTRRVVGLMSGTSADGIDAALVEISGRDPLAPVVRVVCYQLHPYPAQVREQVLRLSNFSAPVGEVCHLSYRLGGLFAEAARRVIAAAGLRPEEVDLIASHGQTIYHGPGGDPPATLQIAEPAVIAERTGRMVVADFRPADIAAGGQGAPLVPFADFLLFRHSQKSRAIQNIGGIANVTYLPAGGGAEAVVAFDTGPGNMLLDGAARALTGAGQDTDGELAAAGRVHRPLLEWLLRHPFLALPPPRSAGREEFGRTYLNEALERAAGLAPADVMATLTAFTVESIAVAYRAFLLPRGPIDEVIVGGGGARNPVLLAELRTAVRRVCGPATRVVTHEEVGLNSEAKEAVAFAILGHAALLGQPANLPAATGAKHPAVLGKIIPGGAPISGDRNE